MAIASGFENRLNPKTEAERKILYIMLTLQRTF